MNIIIDYILSNSLSVSLSRRYRLGGRSQLNTKHICRNSKPRKWRGAATPIRERRHDHDPLAKQR